MLGLCSRASVKVVCPVSNYEFEHLVLITRCPLALADGPGNGEVQPVAADGVARGCERGAGPHGLLPAEDVPRPVSRVSPGRGAVVGGRRWAGRPCYLSPCSPSEVSFWDCRSTPCPQPPVNLAPSFPTDAGGPVLGAQPSPTASTGTQRRFLRV